MSGLADHLAKDLEANRRRNKSGTDGAALSWFEEDLSGADLRGANLAGGLTRYQQKDNSEILGAVDEFLTKAATEPR